MWKNNPFRKASRQIWRFLVPSSSSLRDKNKNFQDISDSLEDNIVKQKYYFELDKRVSSIAQNAKNEGKLVFCDRDFLSALAHNYAVHQQFPETSVYPWMIKAYSKALQHKELIIPDLHIFLDVSLNERIRRKQSDPERIRDNCFLTLYSQEIWKPFIKELCKLFRPYGLILIWIQQLSIFFCSRKNSRAKNNQS